MAVRRRGTSWEIDLRLIDGTRIRKSYATEKAAVEAEMAMKPNPSQRALGRQMRKAARARRGSAGPQTTGKSKPKSESEQPSKPSRVTEISARLTATESRLSQIVSTIQSTPEAPEHTNSNCSETFCGAAGPGQPHSPESPTHRLAALAKRQYRT